MDLSSLVGGAAIVVTGADGWTIWVADACLTECVGVGGGVTLPKGGADGRIMVASVTGSAETTVAVCSDDEGTIVAVITGGLSECGGGADALGETTVACKPGAPGVACG